MATTQGQSLRSKQRTNVMHAYRGRGHRNANLWLVYSVKMDRDYLFPSDRHFLHWINYLETNPDVQSFTLEPEEISTADSLKTNTLEFDAVDLLAELTLSN